MANEPLLFHQQSGEGPKPYEAFCIYRDLGPDRNLTEVSQRLSKSLPLIKRWSARWNWVTRCQVYDMHVERTMMSAREEKVATLENEAWLKRQEAHRERAYQFSQSLLDKANEMMKFPLARIEHVTEVYPDGRPKAITNIYPANWTVSTISKLAESADKLARLASGLPTEVISFVDLLERKGLDVNQVFAELLAEFANVKRD